MDTMSRRRPDDRRARHLGAMPALGVAGGDVDIDLPVGWRRSDDCDPALLAARPPEWPGPVTPSLTVSRVAATAVPSLADYRSGAVASTLLALGGHLVHLDWGYRPVDHVDLTLATEQWGCDLTVTARHVVAAGGAAAVVATGVAGDDDWPDLALALIRAVHSLRVNRRSTGAPS